MILQLFPINANRERVDVVLKLQRPFLQSSFKALEYESSENSVKMLENIVNVLELHEEEIRRHKQKIQLILSEYLMRKYRHKKTQDK